MTFDEYWTRLINRVYQQQEVLVGAEEQLYRLTCIHGETMVDGIEAYFERRWQEFDADMEALRAAGCEDLADDYRAARQAMFGDQPLNEELVLGVVDQLLEESAEVQPQLARLDEIYQRLIAGDQRLMEYRDRLRVTHGLFDSPS